MKLDIDHELSSFVGDCHKLKFCSGKNFIVANYICDIIIRIVVVFTAIIIVGSSSSSSSSTTPEGDEDVQHSLPLR